MDLRQNPDTGETVDLAELRKRAQRASDPWDREWLRKREATVATWPALGARKRDEDRTIFGDFA